MREAGKRGAGSRERGAGSGEREGSREQLKIIPLGSIASRGDVTLARPRCVEKRSAQAFRPGRKPWVNIHPANESRQLTAGLVVMVLVLVAFHVAAQNSVDPCLISGLLPKPVKQIGIEPYCHDFLAARQNDLGILPEIFVRRTCVRISFDSSMHFSVALAAQPLPIRTLSGLQFFSSRCVFHGVLPSTLI